MGRQAYQDKRYRFKGWFEMSNIQVLLASTPEQRRDHHALRYQVYCERRGFEAANPASGGEERDDYDAFAVPFVAYDLRTGSACGAMRLVRGNPVFPAASVTSLNQLRLNELGPSVMELSRLCLRHPNGSVRGDWYQGSDIMLAMIYAAWRYSVKAQVSHWLCLITPAMERMLARLSVPFEAVGDICHFRGTRRPLLTEVSSMVRAAAQRSPRVERMVAA